MSFPLDTLQPQERTVVRHLRTTGSITRMEADNMHGIRHLPGRIHTLRAKGFRIESDNCRDCNGQRYTRFYLLGEPR